MARADARRSAGFLQQTVLRLLRDQSGPTSALRLTEMIHAEGHAVQPSLVFRALRRLTDMGAVRKVELARGYVVAGETPAIDLVCRACGGLTASEAGALHAALRDAVAATGFAAARQIVEVTGLCARCADARGDAG